MDDAKQARAAVNAAAERVTRDPDPTDPEWLAALDQLGNTLLAAEQVDPAAREAMAGTTYAIRGARSNMTGHLRQPGTQTTYCGRPAGARNDEFRILTGWKLCTRCTATEERDRAEAAAVADEHREDTTAEPAAASTWRSDWIGPRNDAALFTLPTPVEQGALFA